MTNDEFTKLYKLFKQLDRKMDDFVTKDEFNKLVNSVDGVAGRIDDVSVELAAVKYDLRRHNRWLRLLADNTATKLTTE